jgi:molybdenum-dependent DNA-binding transcriptional regulator ModE
MTKPKTPRPPRRSNADYRWTKPKMLAFLHALATTGSVAGAARGVGMSRQSAYRLRARLGEGFGAVWVEGLKLAYMRRAAQGDTPRAR